MVALQQHSVETRFHDRRKELTDAEFGEGSAGMILNVKNRGCVCRAAKHWVALLNEHGVFWDMDSKLPAPVMLGDGAAARRFVQDLLEEDSEALVILATWKTGSSANEGSRDPCDVEDEQ